MSAKARQQAYLDIERAMVRIRRSQTRRAIGKLMDQDAGEPVSPAHVFVVDALDDGAPEEPSREPTVGAVAERLGIDPSRASRMVAGAIRAGYVRRRASQTDGRRSILELTGAGRQALERAQRFRVRFFMEVMTDWPDEECVEFGRLLTKFTQSRQRIS